MKRKIQILLSTMHQRDRTCLSDLNIQTDAVVINQCDEENREQFVWENHDITWINSKERGLSKSRNMSLQNASASYVILADDDLKYVEDYENIIVQAFEENSQADIIAFQVEGIEETFKKYARKAKKISYLSSMHISSVEIAIKLENIKKKGICFNELFGAGAEYRMGEENIFLFQCLKEDLNILYIPKKIADLHIGDSTWFEGYNNKYFYDRGATYYEMFGKLAKVMILLFAIKKYGVYKKNSSFWQALKNMYKGCEEYGKKTTNDL